MNEELVCKLYGKAVARCELGEAWEFEKAFTEVLAEHVCDIIVDMPMGELSVNRVKEEFGLK
jgi:hypothetical protein